MFQQNKSQTPKRDRDGLTSCILLQQGANEVLRYISASTPAFDLQALYDTGKLKHTSGSS